MAVDITIALHDPRWASDIEGIKRFVQERVMYVLQHQQEVLKQRMQQEPLEIAVVLTDAREVHSLNKRFRSRDKPTNVLSFPADSEAVLPEGQPNILGDIVLAYDVIKEEAGQQNKHFADHFTHILVHGILHLLGYNHVYDEQADIMEQLERDILLHYGIADPYMLMTTHQLN